MYFAPHTLQVRVVSPTLRDEFGRPIQSEDTAIWLERGFCRCDDISGERITGENGAVYDFKYKVVYPKEVAPITEGSEVRCLTSTGEVRGAGVAKSPLTANYLPYRVIYLE